MSIQEDALGEIKKEYRLIPLLNLRFDKGNEAIYRWVDWCASLGFGGISLIVGHEGDMPAINDAWYDVLLDSTEAAVQRAAELGLSVWIFDEWGYPSGTAAGLVCDNEDFRSKKLHVALDYYLSAGDSVTFQVPDRLVSAGAIPINKYSFYAPAGPCKPLECGVSGSCITYIAGETPERVVLVTWESLSFITHAVIENKPDNFALSTIDLLNPDAVRRFTEVMHVPYYNRLKQYFGTVIKAFFYDEPELCFEYPWTVGLENTFIKKKAYDLRDQLPILMTYNRAAYHPGWDGASALIDKLSADYRDVWTSAAADGFYGGVLQWCHAHGLLSVGHQDMDNHTETLCSVSGDFFKNNRYNDHPGIDVISDNIELGRFNDFPRYAGSCKRFYGKKRAISETFALMGSAQYPDRMRFVLEQQVIRGVDEFILMISEMEPEEPNIHCVSPGDPAIERFGPMINAHVGRAAQVSNIGVPGATTALYIPIDNIYKYQQAKRDAHVNNWKLPWDAVDEIARELTYHLIDFEYIWDDALTMLPLDIGPFTDPSGGRIDTIILPSRVELKNEVLERLKAFARGGGRVITIEAPIADDFEFITHIERLRDVISSSVRVLESSMIAMRHRRTPAGCEIFMLLNEAAKPVDVAFNFNCKGTLCELDLLSGQLHEICTDGASFAFGAGTMRVFITGVPETLRILEPKHKPMRCMNVTDISLALPDGQTSLLGGGKLPPWEQFGFTTYSGDMTYTVRFMLPEGIHDITVSLGEVRYSATISLDGGGVVLLPFYPFEAEFSGVKGGDHTMIITVLNTHANCLLGDNEAEQKMFGGRAPGYLDIDRKYLSSGMIGPLTIRF